jgi:hypothetical protein
MRKSLAVIGCLITPLAIAAKTAVPQPFGINFDDKQQKLEQQLQHIDCRVFNSAPLCRYQPVVDSLFAYYEVQYTAISNSIVSVMGTTKPFSDRFQCQSEMLNINQVIRDKYQLTTAGHDPSSIAYDKPPISMTCTSDNEFHILYRNPKLSRKQLESELRQAQKIQSTQQYPDQF